MADIQLEHGHFRLANRLAEAILAADFEGTQVRVLLALIRLTYGWKRKTVRIPLEQLARLAGVKYTGGFRRLFDALVKHGVVLVVDRGHGKQASAYAIQKDHEQWGVYSIAPLALQMRWTERPDSCDEYAPTGADSERVPPQGQTTVPAPTGAVSMPPQGQAVGPHRGRQAGDNSRNGNALRDRKDSERQERQVVIEEGRMRGADPALAVVLTAAANRGITERWGEQPSPIQAGNGRSIGAAERIAAAGVPADFARDAVYSHALHADTEQPPYSLRFFTEHVIARWREEEARRAAVDVPAPTDLGPPSRPPSRAAPPDRRARAAAGAMAGATLAGLPDD